jgi:hypothetical protein
MFLAGLAIVAASAGLLFATSAVDREASGEEKGARRAAFTWSMLEAADLRGSPRFASAAQGGAAGPHGMKEGSVLVPLVVPEGHPPLLLEIPAQSGQPLRIVQLPSGHPAFGQQGIAGEADADADEEGDDAAEECPYAGSGRGHPGATPHGDADGEADDDEDDSTSDATLPNDSIHRHLHSGALPPGHPPIGPGGQGGQAGRVSRFDRPDWI